jgi:hypothetical protein
MISVIEPLYKATDRIDFGWKPEPGAVTYKVYVGLAPALMTLFVSGVDNMQSNRSMDLGKIPFSANIADVQSTLVLSTDYDFSNTVFYFAITYVDSGGTESPHTPIPALNIIEVPPVGVIPRNMKDDPTINRHPYVFSNDNQKWTKTAGSPMGAVIVDSADFFKSNITLDYTYDTTNLKTIKSYPSDATAIGSPAKLTTYTYGAGGLVSKIQITDSTI